MCLKVNRFRLPVPSACSFCSLYAMAVPSSYARVLRQLFLARLGPLLVLLDCSSLPTTHLRCDASFYLIFSSLFCVLCACRSCRFGWTPSPELCLLLVFVSSFSSPTKDREYVQLKWWQRKVYKCLMVNRCCRHVVALELAGASKTFGAIGAFTGSV